MNLSDLVKKYGGTAPRYTSYPPVPYWKETPTENQWFDHLKVNYDQNKGIDIYIHIPFCESLCSFCGCNKFITKNHKVEVPYIQNLFNEWDLYLNKIENLKIKSIHLGGGTPTFLSAQNLDLLLSKFAPHIDENNFIGSVEVDPRTCNPGHLQVLEHHGISRISLGVQDFNYKVQESIRRIQPLSMVQNLVSKIRRFKFESINFDLIHGLPHQTEESILNTFTEVCKLKPDAIAYYSYAHVPWKVKNQNLINEEYLPELELKRKLYNLGKKLLLENEYIEIGLDHFARPGSFLYKAYKNKALLRSFMGYVDQKSNILIGLGVSAISHSHQSFIQNEKTVNAYEDRLKLNEIPICNGHVHSTEDIALDDIIQSILCLGEVPIETVSKVNRWQEIKANLDKMSQDNLVKLDAEYLRVTEEGKPFLRNISSLFDTYYQQKVNKGQMFSKII